MSNLKKTIQINPELFKIQTTAKNRTKSNREKSKKTITPSFLKKQLIDRIKSHKNKLESSLQQEEEKEKETNKSISTDDDEFIMSMNFLSTLSEEKKASSPKTTFDEHKQQVHIDLPIELLDNQPSVSYPEPIHDTTIPKEEITPKEIVQEPLEENKYTPMNDVPYGCLKNGTKPTYRSWLNKSTISNKPPINNHNETLKMPSKVNHSLLDREKKLNELKNKFSKEKEKEKTFIKRTIKKKYTLGKSNIKKKVGILIKNISTRKKITDSYKELKTHEISDIKKYLRNRGLIRIGNSTPHDVLRKIYESSILSGDVTNNNKDILLHNLLTEDNK